MVKIFMNIPTLPREQKRKVLEQIINCLKQIHDLDSMPADKNSYKIAYLNKTYDRLKKVRYLVPFANDKTVLINGESLQEYFLSPGRIGKVSYVILSREI